MPYTEHSLPFSGVTPQSAHSSRQGADDAAKRAYPQVVRYLELLKIHGEHGLTDAEAAKLMGIERSSVNARRVPLVKTGVVVPGEYRTGATGVKNVAWRLA